jgi:hypothetical protein
MIGSVNERYFIGAYWRTRDETADSFAADLMLFFERAANSEAKLTTWYATRPKLRSTPKPIDLHADSIKKRFKRNRRDYDGIEMPQLGFDFSVWSQLPNTSKVGLSCHCCDVTGNSPNTVIVEFDPQSSDGLPGATAVFAAVVDSFRPEFALFTSNALMQAHQELDFFERPAIRTHGTKW